MEELFNLLNEIQKDQSAMNAAFPQIFEREGFDLSGFIEQDSDYSRVDKEYVDQSGCGDYGFHGRMAIPFENKLIVFNYWE